MSNESSNTDEIDMYKMHIIKQLQDLNYEILIPPNFKSKIKNRISILKNETRIDLYIYKNNFVLTKRITKLLAIKDITKRDISLINKSPTNRREIWILSSKNFSYTDLEAIRTMNPSSLKLGVIDINEESIRWQYESMPGSERDRIKEVNVEYESIDISQRKEISKFRFWLKYKSGIEKFDSEPAIKYPQIRKAWKSGNPSFLPKILLQDWNKYNSYKNTDNVDIKSNLKMSSNEDNKNESKIIRVKKDISSQEIANLMGKKWEEVNKARLALKIDSKNKYDEEEVKLICNYLINPGHIEKILNEQKAKDSSLNTVHNDNTMWWVVGGAAAAAVGIYLLTRNSSASTAAYRGTAATFGGGAAYAASGAGMAAMYAQRVAAINAAAQAAAHQQMLRQIVGIGISAAYKHYFPLYQTGSRGGVFRYTSGGNKHYI